MSIWVPVDATRQGRPRISDCCCGVQPVPVFDALLTVAKKLAVLGSLEEVESYLFTVSNLQRDAGLGRRKTANLEC